MFPFRTSSIFRSRWMAMLWAAGILWTAYDVADSAKAPEGGNAASPVTDATGSAVSDDQMRALSNTIKGL